MTDTPFPGPTAAQQLRAVGTTAALAGRTLNTAFSQTLQHAVDMERYYTSARALGADRVKAEATLREAQGPQAGSSPSRNELDAAIQRLSAGA